MPCPHRFTYFYELILLVYELIQQIRCGHHSEVGDLVMRLQTKLKTLYTHEVKLNTLSLPISG